jgi:hypothetical protein
MRACGRLNADQTIATSYKPIRPPKKMPAPPRKYRLGAQQRLALQFLAGSPFGATDAAMLVNGFHRQMLVRLIRAGLATTEREIKAGQSIGRIRITEAGRRALEGY